MMSKKLHCFLFSFLNSKDGLTGSSAAGWMADMLKLIGSLGGLIFVCFSTSISSALEKLSQERPSTAPVGTPLLMRVLCDISQEVDGDFHQG